LKALPHSLTGQTTGVLISLKFLGGMLLTLHEMDNRRKITSISVIMRVCRMAEVEVETGFRFQTESLEAETCFCFHHKTLETETRFRIQTSKIGNGNMFPFPKIKH